MKISNETKVAILAVVAIGLAIWGYNFIRGKNIIKQSLIYYVEYDEVNMLNISAPVVINGFKVGFVSDIFLKPEDAKKVVVQLDLRKEINIPPDTRAVLKSTGIMGGQAISLLYDGACSGQDCAPSGSYLQGQTLGMLDALVGKDNMREYTTILKSQLSGLLDTLNREFLGEDAEGPLPESLRDLSETMENLRQTSYRLNSLINTSSDDISASLANVRSLTDTLGASQAKIAGLINNAERISSDIAEADLRQTLEDIKTAASSLKSTLQRADSAMDNVSSVAQKLNDGEGSLGKLLQDEDLYTRLDNISLQADSLITDFQDRPYRYVPFKTRKKVKKYDRMDQKEEDSNAAAGN